jgi:hypothetical protein
VFLPRLGVERRSDVNLATELFRTVYGRTPNDKEEAVLVGVASTKDRSMNRLDWDGNGTNVVALLVSALSASVLVGCPNKANLDARVSNITMSLWETIRRLWNEAHPTEKISMKAMGEAQATINDDLPGDEWKHTEKKEDKPNKKFGGRFKEQEGF